MTEQERQPRRRREHVVGRLSHVDVIVRVDARVRRRARSPGSRRRGWRAPRWRSCCATCRRRPGRRRRRTDRAARRPGSRRRPATIASRDVGGQAGRARAFASAAAFLMSTVAVTSSAGAREAADGKVLDGARASARRSTRRPAPRSSPSGSRSMRNSAIGPSRPAQIILLAYASRLSSTACVAAHHPDLDRPAARRARGDEAWRSRPRSRRRAPARR